jgi:FkbM family methyltransferase
MQMHSRTCVAFEPRRRAAALLRRGYRGRVRVYEIALSDREGTAEMRVMRASEGHSTIEANNPLENKHFDMSTVMNELVAIRPLDDIELGRVGFIKIDVEGHEEAVLSGASRTLATSQPTVLVEVEERHHAGSVERVHGLLAKYGYERFTYRAGRLRETRTFDVTRYQNTSRPDEYIRNFIFLPAHRAADFWHLRD